MRRAPVPLLLLVLAACARPEHEVARAVREYDDELVRAYRMGDASAMSRVAEGEEARRVRVLVDLKSAAKLVLESTIESFETTRVRIERGSRSAVVETKERWRYFDRRLTPGEPPGATFVSDMAMRYDLAREDGRWKVRAVTSLSNEYVEGGRPAPASGSEAPHAAGTATTEGAGP